MDIRDVILSENPATTLRNLAYGNFSKFKEEYPELANLKMEIPEGFRHKDNLEHSFKVLENAISYERDEPDLILRTAALFHDIGKPQTRTFSSGGKVSFYNHAEVGACLIRETLANTTYKLNEISEISHLISLHMRAYGFSSAWTEKGIRRLEKDAGSREALDRLILLFKSDLTTGRTEKKQQILSQIDELERIMSQTRESDRVKSLRPALTGFEVMELTGLTEGKEVGMVMKFLNSPEGISLTKEEATKKMWEILSKN